MTDANFFRHRERNQLTLYATPPHECSYLPDREATTIFLDPMLPKNPHIYSLLSRQGFRRSGEHLYRPHCRDCQECVPVRVPVRHFQPRRSQRRIWQKNNDLSVQATAPLYRQEHYELYNRYLAARHPGGGMDESSPHTYMQFLTSRWAQTCFYEFRRDRELVGMAVTDHFEDGLSAVYNYFAPEYPARGLGVYMVLWEIREAESLGLSYLYLGYWIRHCRKMRYKTDYQPLEYYQQGEWRLK